MKHREFLIIAMAASIFTVEIAFAKDTIRGHAGVAYNQYNYNDDFINKSYSGNLFGEFYFSPVMKKQHPWKEAAFLERASGIQGSIGIDKTEYQQYSEDGAFLSFGGTYASTNHPVLLSAAIYHSEDERDVEVTVFKDKFDIYSVLVGYYLRKNLLLGIDYGRTQYKSTYEDNSSTSGELSKYRKNDYGLSMKYLAEYSNGMALGILGRGEYGERDWESQRTDYTKSFQVVPELYFNQVTSLALYYYRGYVGGDSDFVVNQYELSFHRFIGSMFAFQASVSKFDVQSSEGEIISPEIGFGLKLELWF